jgi:hypothetical protein
VAVLVKPVAVAERREFIQVDTGARAPSRLTTRGVYSFFFAITLLPLF